MNGSVRLVGWILGISLFYGSTVASQEEFLTDIRRDIRDDGMEEKSSLFQEAYNSGDYDLARSIAESMQWTLDFQKQLKGDIGEVDIDSNHFEKVDELPSAWKDWAKGWEFFKTIDLSETQGIERTGEPVDIVVAFKTDQTTDLYREIRVAYVNEASG
ncbi:MAG: hypothetical protein KC940_24815, partial [Candidatus Omnitrophica bacterium]|nr:hypothetical protein [Candidatus Omnitrophota bacterium]